jgi:hypothetical protein
MNAVGLAEQESGAALGFYCSNCGRAQLPLHCQNGASEAQLTELHRKAEACCTNTMCPKHEYHLHGWELCPHCINEGPQPAAAPSAEAAK